MQTDAIDISYQARYQYEGLSGQERDALSHLLSGDPAAVGLAVPGSPNRYVANFAEDKRVLWSLSSDGKRQVLAIVMRQAAA
jgi:hypothetical protein